jgi:hypothetical protein
METEPSQAAEPKRNRRWYQYQRSPPRPFWTLRGVSIWVWILLAFMALFLALLL